MALPLLALGAIGAVGGMASSAIQGGFNLYSQYKQNQFNAQQAQIDREFQSLEAQKNRDWQEQMSNTAYQRGVADMEKAGINPAMAMANGGATTPSGATASGSRASGSATSISQPNLLNTAIISSYLKENRYEVMKQAYNLMASNTAYSGKMLEKQINELASL